MTRAMTRAMQAVLHGLLWDTVLAYLDDVIVLGDSFDSHLHNLVVVFERFREHNLKLKPSKCSLINTQVKFLGKIVSVKGTSIDPGNTSKVQDWPEPRSVNEVEIFLGFMNYHREYIKTYADIAAPLYQLTGSRGKTKGFKWGIEHQVAFRHRARPTTAGKSTFPIFIGIINVSPLFLKHCSSLAACARPEFFEAERRPIPSALALNLIYYGAG